MSDANLQVGIESSQAVAGGRTVVRSLNDISSAATSLDIQLKNMQTTLNKLGNTSGFSQAKRSMQELNSSSDDLKKMLTSIEDRFIRITATAAGMWLLKQAIDALSAPLIKSIEYLTLMDTASLGIASSLLVVGNYVDTSTGRVIKGQAAMKLAQNESKEIMDQLRVANMNTIATLDELIVAYHTALPLAMARGFNKKQVLEFTTSMVQAAGAIGLPFNQMSEEIRSLLTEGAINPRNSRIATVLGLRNEDLREYKNNAQGLFDFLMKRLEGFTIAGEESQKTMKGIWSNLIDVAKQLGGTAFEGVFEGLRSQMKQVLDNIVTFDNVAKKANWNESWVQGAKDVNEWLTKTFNSLVSLAKTIIEHRELISSVVQMYIGYQVVSTLATVANKMLSASIVDTNAAMIAKANALRILGVEQSALLTTEQASTVVAKEKFMSDGRSLTLAAEQIAAKKAEVLAINQAAQAKIVETAQMLENVQVMRWEIGLEQDSVASKISAQRANAQLLVQERLLAESRYESAAALAKQSISENGRKFSSQFIEIERRERELLSVAIARETEAIMGLESTMIRLSGLEAEQISLKQSQVIVQNELLAAKIRAIEVDNAAVVATDRHNAALARNGAAYAAVTVAEVTKIQTDWLSLTAKERMIVLEEAHTLALEMNAGALRANALGHVALTEATVATTGASKALQTVWSLMGGWIGVVIIAVYGLYKAWQSLIEIEEEYYKNKKKLDDESYSEKLKKDTEDINKRIKELNATPESKAKDAQDEYTQAMQKTRQELDAATTAMNNFKQAHKHELKDIAEETTLKKALVFEYKALNDEIARKNKTLTEGSANYAAKQAAQAELNKIEHKANPYKSKAEGSTPLTESEKQFNRLVDGYKKLQKEASATGRVEDELGAKIEVHRLNVSNLLAETSKASGSEATRMRDNIKLYDEEIVANLTLAANKKAQKAIDDEIIKQSLHDHKLSIDQQKSELKALHEFGTITTKEYYERILGIVKTENKKELEILQANVDKKKEELDSRAELYWNDQLSYSEYLKSVLALIEAENKLKNLKSSASKAISDANVPIIAENQKEKDAISDLNIELLTLTKQYYAAAKAKTAFIKASPAYQKMSPGEKKKTDALNELNEFDAKGKQVTDAFAGASSIGTESFGTKFTKIDSKYEIETEMIKKQYSLRLADLNQFSTEYKAISEERDRSLLNNKVQYEGQITSLGLDAAEQGVGLLRQAAGESVEIQIAAMVAEKAIAISRIMINTEVAASALKMAYAGIPGGLAIAAAQEATMRALSYVSIAMVGASAVVEGLSIAGKREFGGPVEAGKSYIVGEKRAEIFTPSSSGYIYPEVPSQGRGETVVVNQNITIDARGADSGVEAKIQNAMLKTKEETKSEILASMNRGGTFATASGRR